MSTYQTPVQDTVSLTLSGEKTVVNRTVKLVASISGIVAIDSDDAKMRAEIVLMMKKIVDTDWQFSNLQRSSHESGLEELSVVASARVEESENHRLDDRRKAASKSGLSITGITADTTVPQSLLNEAESDLRVELVGAVKKEKEKLETALGRTYRIGALQFSSVSRMAANAFANSAPRASAKTAYGSGFLAEAAGEDDSLGNASKIMMSVQVQLSTSADS